MACFKPLKATQALQPKSNGKKAISFSEGADGLPVKIPCGRCIGCRLRRASDWATRIMHEAQLNGENNCFITLTYGPEHLPFDGGLVHRDFQLFFKRLRKKYSRKKIKYYMCGEYGDKNNRPHYHAILFGHNFEDWVYLGDTESGNPLYTSPTLESIWQKGFVQIGTVTRESAGYVARYCMKKINGPLADEINLETGLKHYERFDSLSGHIVEVMPEYARMSRGGRSGRGIGYDWISRFTGDVYPKDFTTINGVRVKPSRYYDNYLEEFDKDMFDDIKAGRLLAGFESEDETESRLLQREKVKEAQFSQLKRSL
jgi:hypothetical protein